jgi:hypothetical protein
MFWLLSSKLLKDAKIRETAGLRTASPKTISLIFTIILKLVIQLVFVQTF